MKAEEKSSAVAARPVGAWVTPSGVSYRAWAPDEPELGLQVERDGTIRRIQLAADEAGYWSIFDSAGRAGDLYRFGFADGRLRPDVASRFQPQGVHGPSECIDPRTYHWQCGSWRRPGWSGQSIYEIHVGGFSGAGTFRDAITGLDHVAGLGVEAIELMPVADFAGDRNWGYDGVALYAPARCYGRPDELRSLVDGAHARGLAVILDVVYNHLGPSGNYLPDYSADYFRTDQPTPWGRAFNLDGPRSRAVRDFLVGNAAYWLDEFRFDGLRLDATHALPDRSDPHLLAEIAAAVHARGGFLVAEDERNDARIVTPARNGGIGIDAAWADDFHHQVRVALTGARESYFEGYCGSAADLASTLSHGWTYRGQPYAPWGGRPRGSACAHLPPSAFVICIENHDQIGNRADGERLEHLVTPGQFRAASLLLCLSPYVPMVFMGQEWAASTPFLFFTDHGGELGGRISAGRRREFAQAGRRWSPGGPPDPEALSAFTQSKLQWPERTDGPHAATLELYREGFRQRRACLRGAALERSHWNVRQMGGFVAIRYQVSDGERLLVAGLRPEPFPGPSRFLEPPAGRIWQVVLHSEEQRFGGEAAPPGSDPWRSLQGPAALWLQAVEEGHRHAAA